jgi:hypothetical protein
VIQLISRNSPVSLPTYDELSVASVEDEPKGALIRRFGHPSSGTSTEELSTMSRDTANSCNQLLLGAPEAI